MANENGTWIMYGVEWDDPECIHTVDEAIEYINEVGFLPLFKNEIPGFSLEERTVPEYWWCEDPKVDPWEWREIIARSGKVAYGKFFDKKAGFISKEWFPYFANYRRDGYDFDALWDDEKASMRQKKIMDLFSEGKEDAEYFSYELKQNAGFGKEGEKGFDGALTGLQMQMYLCLRDFRQRKNKKGQYYGWPIAVYSTPEHLWGYDVITSAYNEIPVESGKRIAMHLMEVYPIATAEQIKTVLGNIVGETPERAKKEKKVDYPANLLKDLDLKLKSLNEDQMIGLEYALGTLKLERRGYLEARYEQGKTYKEIGKEQFCSGATASKHCKQALNHLKKPEILVWITEGFNGHIESNNATIKKIKDQFIKAGKLKQASMLDQTPDVLVGISKQQAQFFFRAGYPLLGNIVELIENDGFWYDKVSGIGHTTGQRIIWLLARDGYVSRECEAYKMAMDDKYFRIKSQEKHEKRMAEIRAGEKQN